MSDNLYDQWYGEFKDFVDVFSDDKLFGSLESLIHSSRNTFAMNRKVMEKVIDVSWVEAIENGIIHLDNFLRAPRKTIEDVEEIVPIALSRKITVESVKHLAQHTDYIQSIDKKTGKITPSKILNIYKEESWMTYENKFINTLIDRLYIFINTRYEKLAQVTKDEKVMALGYDTDIDDGSGGKFRIQLKVEATESLDAYNDSGMTIWQRVEKLKKIIESYKGSELCQKLGTTYIRPPVMRTNAIMKNVDLKACLSLWQYIESYDRVGYTINVENTAVQPAQDYIEDFYKIVILNFLLFRSYNSSEGEKQKELKTQKPKTIAPKVVKRFDKDLPKNYQVSTDTAAGYITSGGEMKFVKQLPENLTEVYEQINIVINAEREYLKKLEEKRLKKLKALEEAERLRMEEEERRREQARIEEARRQELERIRLQREEEERQLQEMLDRKRAEQEAAERERQRQEAERQARLAEIQKREEEARLKREEQERIEAERKRLEDEKNRVRSEFGGAEGIDKDALERFDVKDNAERLNAYNAVTDEEIEQVMESLEESPDKDKPEFEDPREVAARIKHEQQKREKERREKERADQLKAERKYYESKPFETIRKEYSKNPIYVIPRLIRYILAMVFNIFPKETDRPDFRRKRAANEERIEQVAQERMKRNEMEYFYKKYGQTFRYRFMRHLSDKKFKRQRRKEDKKRPKPVYKPPVRTKEEQLAIDKQMKELYRTYHVSRAEKFRRWRAQRKRKYE